MNPSVSLPTRRRRRRTASNQNGAIDHAQVLQVGHQVRRVREEQQPQPGERQERSVRRPAWPRRRRQRQPQTEPRRGTGSTVGSVGVGAGVAHRTATIATTRRDRPASAASVASRRSLTDVGNREITPPSLAFSRRRHKIRAGLDHRLCQYRLGAGPTGPYTRAVAGATSATRRTPTGRASASRAVRSSLRPRLRR